MMLRALLLIAACASLSDAFVHTAPHAARIATTQLEAFATATTQVDELMKANSALIEELRTVAPDYAEIDLLRFAMGFDTKKEATSTYPRRILQKRPSHPRPSQGCYPTSRIQRLR